MEEKNLFYTTPTKGQEMSEANFLVLILISSKRPTIFFPDFCPNGLKWVESNKNKKLNFVKYPLISVITYLYFDSTYFRG